MGKLHFEFRYDAFRSVVMTNSSIIYKEFARRYAYTGAS